MKCSHATFPDSGEKSHAQFAICTGARLDSYLTRQDVCNKAGGRRIETPFVKTPRIHVRPGIYQGRTLRGKQHHVDGSFGIATVRRILATVILLFFASRRVSLLRPHPYVQYSCRTPRPQLLISPSPHLPSLFLIEQKLLSRLTRKLPAVAHHAQNTYRRIRLHSISMRKQISVSLLSLNRAQSNAIRGVF